MKDEAQYERNVEALYGKIEAYIDTLATDAIECDRSGGVLTLTKRRQTLCVINIQRPTRQIWMAASGKAWHFSYDEHASTWQDDKGRGDLMVILEAIVQNAISSTS